jgi:hypothetical protein
MKYVFGIELATSELSILATLHYLCREKGELGGRIQPNPIELYRDHQWQETSLDQS